MITGSQSTHGGKRKGAGRTPIWDKAKTLALLKGIQERWWQEMATLLDSTNMNDKKFALSEINKLQVKSLPTALTGEGGGPVQLEWSSPSTTNPVNGPKPSMPA